MKDLVKSHTRELTTEDMLMLASFIQYGIGEEE
jgi:hypothetical protein